MGIDWFTFVAQILNFVILLFLLKRFLYRPVLDAIARREQGIRDQLDDARRKEEKAEAEGRALREERAELESRRDRLLEEAEREADERRQELAEEVRAHADRVKRDWKESLRRQRESFLQELRHRMGEETVHVAAQALRDLADAELEERVIRVFLQRMEGMEEEARDEFLAALAEASGRLGIRTSFPVPSEHRGEIEGAVRAWAGSDVDLHFEEDPELALGIEMRAGDRKVGWSVGSYLDALEARTSRLLEAEGR
jgi:F-type H+-transporting ATPase subunit b